MEKWVFCKEKDDREGGRIIGPANDQLEILRCWRVRGRDTNGFINLEPTRSEIKYGGRDGRGWLNDFPKCRIVSEGGSESTGRSKLSPKTSEVRVGGRDVTS